MGCERINHQLQGLETYDFWMPHSIWGLFNINSLLSETDKQRRQKLAVTTAPVTSIYKSVGASFCRITSSFGGKYYAFISETFKIYQNKSHLTVIE